MQVGDKVHWAGIRWSDTLLIVGMYSGTLIGPIEGNHNIRCQPDSGNYQSVAIGLIKPTMEEAKKAGHTEVTKYKEGFNQMFDEILADLE